MDVSGQIHAQVTLLPVRNEQEFKLALQRVWMSLSRDKSLAPTRSRKMILERPGRSPVTTHTELSQLLYIFLIQ